jgi:hypothetical protein
MSVAFNDVVILRDTLRHIKDLANARAVASAIKEWHSLRYPTASTVNILSYCLYTLFASGPGTPPHDIIHTTHNTRHARTHAHDTTRHARHDTHEWSSSHGPHVHVGTTLGPMREACMGYFKLGGICASGPMNLLAMYVLPPPPVVVLTAASFFFLSSVVFVLSA